MSLLFIIHTKQESEANFELNSLHFNFVGFLQPKLLLAAFLQEFF